MVFTEKGDELLTKCIFNGCDDDSLDGEYHLYINKNTSQYWCHKCGSSGNIKTLAKHFGDNDIELQDTPMEVIPVLPQKVNLEPALVEKCKNNVPERIRKYLNQRGITSDIIAERELGWGFFYKRWWITIPVKDQNSNLLFLKLRKDPEDENNHDKYKSFPMGMSANVYGVDRLNDKTAEVVVCEGELDQMILNEWGIDAITSTAGAGTFKKECLGCLKRVEKIYICLDNDEAGKNGTDKLIKLFEENLPESVVYRIDLPDRMPVGGDITEYFEKYSGNPDELMRELPKLVSKKERVDFNKFQPIAIGELMKMEFSDKEWIIEKIVPCQGITIISGAPASYKTWLTLEAAKSIASGVDFLGKFKCKKSNVLIIDEENHLNLIKKRLDLLSVNPNLPIHLLSQKNFIVTDEKLIKQVIEICDANDIGVIIIDSLVRINNAEENDASQMSKVFQSIRKLCQSGRTVVLTHHERKESLFKSSAQSRLRGSSDISASIDAHLSITRDKENQHRLIVEQPKNRYETEMEPWEIEIKQEKDKISFSYLGAHSGDRSKKEEAKEIIKGILEESSDGLSKTEIALKVREVGSIGEKNIREGISMLMREGAVKEKQGDGNTKICYLSKPG